jgi:hypothetical protein
MQQMVVNSDNLEVSTTMNAGGFPSATFDGCSFMLLDFTHVFYEHCPKKANVAAHELANPARSSPGTWMDNSRPYERCTAARE